MRGKNPAWVIPISDEKQIETAILSGRVIRRSSPEPLVAFVSSCLKPESIIPLHEAFNHVILAPSSGKDVLLVETLTLTLFTALVVVRDGALVFWKFDEAFEAGAAFLQSGTQEKNWMLVAVAPNSERYLAAVNILQSGRSVDSKFIMDFIATVNKEGLPKTIGVSWSGLKYYDGVKIPLVQLDLETMREGIHSGDGMVGFWQKEIGSALVALPNFEKKINPHGNDDGKETNGVAIVGMSCRFPGANSVDEYWDVLSSGVSSATAPPTNRLGKCELREGMRANFLKCPIDEFDAAFFDIAPGTAAVTDPQARLLLEVSWEAFEDTGMNPEKLRGSPVGVFYGSWAQEYKDMLNKDQKADQDLMKKYTGNGFSCTASKLSFFYGFTGPNIAIESACSSSLLALQTACQNLLLGNCPLALAAGANVILQMDTEQKVLWAPDATCRSFDSKPNGYGRGEGVGVLVLKRYSDALRDGDRIHGIILGSASSQDGLTHSFATPTMESEARTMESALLAAKVHPTDVDYVEAHATGTRVGDPIEAAAIVKAYSSPIKRQSPLLVGSVKTNIGHAESCSGIASVIKILLALRHETIPPHINVEVINPKVDFSPIPARLTLQREEWKRSEKRARIAGISNYGITGTNLHMLIREPPQQQSSADGFKNELGFTILTLSAKTSFSMEQLTTAYIDMLENGEDSLAAISYSANAGRAHLFPFRKAVVASTKEELITQLKEQVPHTASEQMLKVAFICHDLVNDYDFEQYSGLFSKFPVFQISMEVCDAICKLATGFSPVSHMVNHKITSSSSSSNWERKHWQCSTFSVTFSLYKLWESWGVNATAVLGVNFGELVGAAISGKLELEQCFRLIMNEELPVDNREEKRLKTNIHYISTKEATEELSLEHWQQVCCEMGESRAEISSILLEMSAKYGCEIVIQLDLQKKLEFDSQKVMSLPIHVNNGLLSLLSSLATLYKAGFPVEWDGFYAHQSCRKVSLPHYPFQRKSFWFKRENDAHKSNLTALNCLHPLLGRYVPSDEERVSIFENSLSFRNQAPYLAGHVIGSEMIFPGAAHLELLLAASFQLEGGMPFIIENFKIHQPLHVPSNSEKILRTLMSKDETGWNIVVESLMESGTWIRFASGELNTSQPQLTRPQALNIESLKGRLIEQKSGSSEFYKKLEQLGLNFSEEFKTLQNIHESECQDEILATVSIPPDTAQYVCHPLLADAMLQCFIFHKWAELATLAVPVGISKFVCHRRLRPTEYSRTTAATLFVYFNKIEKSVFLLDSNGAVIATMNEPQMKATSVGAILTAAGFKNSRAEELDVWQVCWKAATKYQTEGSVAVGLDITQSSSYVSLLRRLERHNVFTPREKELFNQVDRLSELFVLKAFYELGWQPKLNETLSLVEVAAELQISQNFYNAFRHFLGYFEKSGVLTIWGERKSTKLKVVGQLEKREMVEKSITQFCTALVDYEPIDCLVKCGSALAPVLQGRLKGQQILFEAGAGGVTPAEIMYKGYTCYKHAGRAAPKIFFEIATQLWHNEEENTGERRRLRVLEIGGGTGVFTNAAIPLLEEDGIDYNYHFTDISSHFLKKLERRFPHLIYNILDVEKDPLEQGFPPACFDIVVGLDVLHATKNLRQSLGHLKMLLKPGGYLLIGETSTPIKEIDVTFGILDGYWRFEDHDIRATHCTMSAEQWLELLKEIGFRGASSKVGLAEDNLCVVVGTLSNPGVEKPIEETPPMTKTWLLLHDSNGSPEWVDGVASRMWNLGRHLISYSIHEKESVACLKADINLEGILCLFQGADSLASNNCQSLLEPLMLAAKLMIEKGSWTSVPRFCVATSGLWMECERESSPSTATLWGFLRSVRMEVPWLTTKLVDLDPDVEFELRMDALFQEIWMGDDETEAVYRGGIRFARRLTLLNPETKNSLQIPNLKDYTVELPSSNLLSDLRYIPKQIEKLGGNEVVVEVRAVALNFRDVFSVLKPSGRLKDLDTMGMDFSGVVSSVGSDVKELKVGSPVFGICFDKTTVSGYISIPTQNVVVVPGGLSFAEAATLPLAFLTAWHCLVDVAHASEDQTILIHAGSGGVGLVAIQIAKHFGLNIVATAGSQRKRKFLRKLGIPHVFNSRTLEFGEKIMALTNGQGVDIVLNCLTGPGFKETSLNICKDGGYFVEISKLDIWEEWEVIEKRPQVNYSVADLSVSEPILITRLLASLSEMLGSGFIKPVPYTRFAASRIVSALQFLQKAKQIGKVVVEMPHFDAELNTFKDMLLNDRSSYLITGGKGAIGLAIAEWMVAKGAKYLVLLGRSPPNEKALDIMQKLEEEAGAKIISVEGDVADYARMDRVLQDIHGDPSLPPLRGIHHCAGVLSDAMVVNQDWASLEHSLNPKVKGSYNLHLLTCQTPLEFFVVHSSLTCVLGNPGQSNHTAGCLYTESLMESRVENGLPGMSISWGHWDAGLAKNREMETLTGFTIPQGIAALNKFFLENMSCGGAGFMTPSKICDIFPAYEKTLFETIPLEDMEENGIKAEEVKESFLTSYQNVGEDEQLKQEVIRNMVKNTLCDTLGITFQEVEERVQFARMGLDSLMNIEFYNKLQSAMETIELGHIDMEQYGTVDQLTTIIKTALDDAMI